MIAPAQPGTVYLVGAGPGNVELLTLRAHALISSASCVLHDDLVSDSVLSMASPQAVVRNVGKRCGPKIVTQEQINRWMVERAQAGDSVVRLKSGDPLLFGRAVDEIEALVKAEVLFEIVPGVSTGFAAAALAALPLTGRITSSRVLFATRHLAAGETSGLAGIGPNQTLVLYMPGRDYAAIARELEANGWLPATPVVLASSLGTPAQHWTRCSLRELAIIAPLPTPAIMIFSPEFPKA